MELLIILILTVLNGFFSMSEIALISVKKSQLIEKRNKKNKNAAIALKLLEKPENFLSAVQVGITLIGIVSGVFGGVALSDDLSVHIAKIPFLVEYAQQISFVVVIMLITYLSIVIGELFPKTIALNNSLKIALFAAPIISVFTMITNPIVWLLSISTKLLLKIFAIKAKSENNVSEEELKVMLKLATEQGVLENKVHEYINNIFRFDDRTIKTVMRNRNDIIWLDINADIKHITDIFKRNSFSQYPVCEGILDNIVGLVRVRYFFEKYNLPNFKIKDILIEPNYFTGNQLTINVLENFRKSRVYFGMVVNEYGEIEGLITLHDIVEEILGQLPDVNTIIENNIIKREDNSYLVNGQTKLDELPEYLNLEPIENANFTTLAGYIITFCNHIPKEGECFTIGKYTFEIVDMDFNRIDKILIKQIK